MAIYLIQKNMRTNILIGMIASFSFASCMMKTPVEEVDQVEIKAEIQTLEDANAKAMNDKDALGAAAYYSEDIKSYPYGSKPLIGEKAMIDAMEKDVMSIPVGHKITFTANEIKVFNNGDAVLEIGDFILTDGMNKKVESGNFFALFEKRDGKYVCVRDIFTPDYRVTVAP